jgi:ACS family hexuronate transporter-like MFS transporter
MAGVKIKRLRWWMIALLMLGAILNYLTRSTLSVAATTLLAELHISEREDSWITAAFEGASCCSRSAASSSTPSA